MDIDTLTNLKDRSEIYPTEYVTTPRVDLSKVEADKVEISGKTKVKLDAPIVDFFKKVYGGIGNIFKQAHESKNNKKAEGADFTERAKEWGKTFSKEGKTLLMAELLPQLKTVLGIPSVKKVAEDKGLSAAVLEGFKMGLIDAVTLTTYFGIMIPFVASGAAAAVNTFLNNVPFLKPYAAKIKEQEMAKQQNQAEETKAQEEASNEINTQEQDLTAETDTSESNV